MSALVVLAALAVPRGSAGVQLPTPERLIQAMRSGDDVEIERVAGRLGAIRLEHLAERGHGEERVAALRALAVVDDSWRVLPELARLIAVPQIAEAASVTARRIAEGMSPALAVEGELERDVPTRAAAELLARAADSTTPLAARINAVAAAALRAVCRIDDAILERLLIDPNVTLRRAAAEALGSAPIGSASDGALLAAVSGDASVEVAATAAAALCREVPVTAGSSAAERRANGFSGAVRARLRALAIDGSVPLVDRLDLLPCLRTGTDPADRKVLDQLAQKGPEPLRRKARALFLR